MRKMLGGDKKTKTVSQPLQLVAAAGCQGIAISKTEATILLDYLGGHDYDRLMSYWKQQYQRGYISRDEYLALKYLFDGARLESEKRTYQKSDDSGHLT